MAAIRSGIKALIGSKAPLSDAQPIGVSEFAKAFGEVCGLLGKDAAQPRKFGECKPPKANINTDQLPRPCH